MEARAVLKTARIAPRKVEIVLNLIRGKDLETALAIVKHTPKAACEYLEKLLNSAAANAENNFGLDKKTLYVKECYVSPGPTMKRMQPVSKGRGHKILKRTSNITVVLGEAE
ncbi:MAG: 50S ribosomal protein L22 [Oscillospiraceae bacterium]|nr:50S ribosomal protein L22 [Ruminococcus sp.]MCD8345121.1 50S ribosomal protein L22 [Oscillospiraceae bacterium]